VGYDEVVACNAFYPDCGTAFTLTEHDDLFLIDLDKCRDPLTGNCTQAAANILAQFEGALIEVSQSGTGFHIIGRYSKEPEHSCRNALLNAEFYTRERYIALGDMSTAVGDSNKVFDLTQFAADYFPPTETFTSDWTDGPVEGYTCRLNDEELLKLAMKSTSSNVFGGAATFAELWEGTSPKIAAMFPSNNDRDPYDRSRVDGAIAQTLAFWTGKDCARIERMMRTSPHVREKWERHRSYLHGTIKGAVGRQTNCYSVTKPREEPLPSDTGHNVEARARGSNVVIQLDELPEFFRHYVYLIHDDKIIDKRNGATYNQRQFSGMLGGWMFQVGQGEKVKLEKDAFIAFTRNSLYEFPRVYGETFRPDLPSWHTFEEDGHVWINSFQDVRVRGKPGDVTLFLDHIHAMLPNGDDAKIFLCFLAAVLQYPGRKFTWCPVVVGAEGNGKSWIVDMVMQIIGHRYCYKPTTKDLMSNFNAYEDGKLFIPIEELRATTDILEGMKVSITNERVRVEAKGKDGRMVRNFANYVINTNHIDGVPIDENSRRFCMLVCAQQTAKDIARDFGGDHFVRLFDWRDKEGGLEAVAYYLEHMEIDPRYNPAGMCNRAPITTGTNRVIRESLCIVGKHIQNAIEEGRQGFRNDWVSSAAVTRLLKELRLDTRNPPSKYKAILNRLDYEWCPSLEDTKGRVRNHITVEGCKPVLYCRRGSLQHLNMMSPAQVRASYMAAQDYTDVLPPTNNGENHGQV
jgi:hypothetical protein